MKLCRPALALLAALCLSPCLSSAQPSVVVTGVREPISSTQLAADVTVIDRRRIEATAADSLEVLLQREAGIQLSRNGGPGANAGLFVRGASSAQTLVLVDGVRVGSATAGQTEFEGLALANIERVEVLRGPASSLYGADALGGVVHIITRAPQHGLSVALGMGGEGERQAALTASTQIGGLSAAATLAHDALTGRTALRAGDMFGNHNPDRDGFSRSSANVRLGLAPASGHELALKLFGSRLNAQYDSSEYLPPLYAPNARPDFRNHLALQSAALEHRASWAPAWTSLVRASWQSSLLDSGGSVLDRFRTQRQQLDTQVTWRPQREQQLTLALDALHERADSTLYNADVSRRNAALVLAYAGRVAGLDVQADARSDHSSVYGTVGSGRLGASLALTPKVRLRGLVGNTFRAPSFNDLYYPGFGVATLKPERGRSGELGLNFDDGATTASVTLWRNAVRELIAYEADRRFCPSGFAYDFGCARNIGRARLQGASLAASTRQGPWYVSARADFLDARDQASGSRLVRRAAHQEALTLQWSAMALRLGAELQRVGARPEGGRMLAPYTTLDFSAGWRIDAAWSLTAKLRNATAREYEPALDYQSPGRQAWLGLAWRGG
jgi:vitamin B12 transporter